MKAKEILETLISNDSLKMECFEYGIDSQDIRKAIEEVEELQELREMVQWMEENSNGSLCDFYNKD